MTKEKNSKYEWQAIHLLNGGLINCPWNVDDETKLIDKKRLLEMFNLSCQILQKNKENDTNDYANAVFISCVSVVRCLCIKDEDASKILIQNREYTLNPLVQYECAIESYKLIKL